MGGAPRAGDRVCPPGGGRSREGAEPETPPRSSGAPSRRLRHWPPAPGPRPRRERGAPGAAGVRVASGAPSQAPEGRPLGPAPPAGLSRLGFPASRGGWRGAVGRGRKGSWWGGRESVSAIRFQAAPSLPRPAAQAGVRCSVCTGRARAPPPRPAGDPAFYSRRTRRTHTPPSGTPRAASGDAGADTHPAPGQGVPLTRRSPRPTAPPSPPHPTPAALRPGRGAPIWGEEIARLSATPSSPPNPALRGHREPGSRPGPGPPRTGAVRRSGAEEGVSAPWSPPHAPYRGFLDPFCPPGGARPPRRAHRDPLGRRCPPRSPTCVPGEASAGRAPPGCPLGGLREARGQPAHVRARVCFAPAPAPGP